MWLDRARHLPCLLPIRMGTMCLGWDITPCRYGWLASFLPFHRSNLPRCRKVYHSPVVVSAIARCQHRICPIQMSRIENLNYRECVSQTRNADPRIYPILASLWTWERDLRLKTSDFCPLVVCTSSKMAAALLSSTHIAARLQAAAKAAHGITIKEEFKKWTSHSIRVGSYVLLGEGGHDSPFIKIRLFSESDTFLLCLRNTACIAA